MISRMGLDQFRAQPKSIQVLGVSLFVGVVGLLFAFLFPGEPILHFGGIGIAAAVAPVLGVILPLWAMETDANDRPDIPKGPAHH